MGAAPCNALHARVAACATLLALLAGMVLSRAPALVSLRRPLDRTVAVSLSWSRFQGYGAYRERAPAKELGNDARCGLVRMQGVHLIMSPLPLVNVQVCVCD